MEDLQKGSVGAQLEASTAPYGSKKITGIPMAKGGKGDLRHDQGMVTVEQAEAWENDAVEEFAKALRVRFCSHCLSVSVLCMWCLSTMHVVSLHSSSCP